MTRVHSSLFLMVALVGFGLLCGCGPRRPSAPNGTVTAGADRSARPTVSDAAGLAPKGLFVSRGAKQRASSLLVAGDSLSIGLGEQLERTLGQEPGLRFRRLGRVSSGLARPDFFDWEATMTALVERMHPDVALIMLGTNDSKLLRTEDGSQLSAAFGSPEWDRAYAAWVERILAICRAANPGVIIFWVGSPVMADPGLSRELKHVNAVISRVVAAHGDCYFLDTWELFSGPDRRYVSAKPDLADGSTLRARDGVHLTQAGAQALAEFCRWAMESRVRWTTLQGRRAVFGFGLADAS
ncbi:hypothetical protein JCM15519_09480 [Fundidesulfovibrio butyratiphilus]